MSILKADLANAVYHLSGNKIHDDTIDFIHDMYEGRDYHNLDHVEYALNEMYHHFDESGLSDAEKCELIIAIVFHDLYQDLLNPITAVIESADLMEECLCDVLSVSDIKNVKALIFSTGVKTPTDDAELVMHDSDYAILGNESWNEYHAYSKAIEKEATEQNINSEHFNIVRIKFLLDLLEKPNTIFCTSYFGKNYEWQARKNILREIGLRKSGEF